MSVDKSAPEGPEIVVGVDNYGTDETTCTNESEIDTSEVATSRHKYLRSPSITDHDLDDNECTSTILCLVDRLVVSRDNEC